MSEEFKEADRLSGIEENVWEEIYRMKLINKPVNLASGSPDYIAQPKTLINALVDVTLDPDFSLNQYTRGNGHQRLVDVLAKLYGLLLNREIDSENNILTTAGAYGALFCSIFSIINPSDEVIIIEPHFDSYSPVVRMAGGLPVYIALKPINENANENSSKKLSLDFIELESKFTSKTRLIIINTPHNPSGKVFTRTELEKIADLCKRFNVIALMDEVYEWITYEENKHFRIASLPGMFEKSITIGSISKSLSVTGWRCGWALTGNLKIRNALSIVQQNSYYAPPTNIQEATARALEIELEKLKSSPATDTYFTELTESLLRKRDFMFKMLCSLGLKPIIPEGGYFMIADCKHLIDSLDLSQFDDKHSKGLAFVKWMSKNGIQAIPMSVFYSKEYKYLGETYLRFCFFKNDETLHKAQQVLGDMKKKFFDFVD